MLYLGCNTDKLHHMSDPSSSWEWIEGAVVGWSEECDVMAIYGSGLEIKNRKQEQIHEDISNKADSNVLLHPF